MTSSRHGQLPLRAGECVGGGGRFQVGTLPSPGLGPALLSPGILQALPTFSEVSGGRESERAGRSRLSHVTQTTGLGGRVAPPLTSRRRGFGDLEPHVIRLGSAGTPHLLRTPAGTSGGLTEVNRTLRTLVSSASFGASDKNTPLTYCMRIIRRICGFRRFLE